MKIFWKIKVLSAVFPCIKCSSKNRLIFLWSYFTAIFVSEEKIIVKTSHLPFLILELIKSTYVSLYLKNVLFRNVPIFKHISPLYWKHKPDGISIVHMKLTFFVLSIFKYKSVWKFFRSAPGEHPRDTRAGKYIQIVHHDLKRSKLQKFLEKHHTC